MGERKVPSWVRRQYQAKRAAEFWEKARARAAALEPYVKEPPGKSLAQDLSFLCATLRTDMEDLTRWAEDAERDATMVADKQRYGEMAEYARRLEGQVTGFLRKWGDVL